MDPEELGSADCLKRLIVDSEGIYLGVCFRKETINSLVFVDIQFHVVSCCPLAEAINFLLKSCSLYHWH